MKFERIISRVIPISSFARRSGAVVVLTILSTACSADSSPVPTVAYTQR